MLETRYRPTNSLLCGYVWKPQPWLTQEGGTFLYWRKAMLLCHVIGRFSNFIGRAQHSTQRGKFILKRDFFRLQISMKNRREELMVPCGTDEESGDGLKVLSFAAGNHPRATRRESIESNRRRSRLSSGSLALNVYEEPYRNPPQSQICRHSAWTLLLRLM